MDSSQSEFFQGMYDQQMSLHLSGDPGIGLANMIVRQLSPEATFTSHAQRALGDYRQEAVVTTFSASDAEHKPVKVTALKSATPIKTVELRDELKHQTVLPITSKEQFVKQLWSYAEQAAEQLGVQPRVLIAQAALETGWGKAVINKADGNNSHNLFNIKADKYWQGSQAKVASLEYEHGVAKKHVSGFRVYDSFQESFQDYVSFIKNNPRYRDALQQAKNPQRYMQALQQAGYATDPNYADKVMQIYHDKALLDHRAPQQLVLNNAE
jgi:flagellar protein FlgJ